MAIRNLDNDSDTGQAILIEEFTRRCPEWEWSERRKRNRLMWDEQGRVWTPKTALSADSAIPVYVLLFCPRLPVGAETRPKVGPRSEARAGDGAM